MCREIGIDEVSILLFGTKREPDREQWKSAENEILNSLGFVN
jgi:hypothetical protein